MPKNYHTIIVQDNNNSVNSKMAGLMEKVAQNGNNQRLSTESNHETGIQEARYNHQRESRVATKLLNPNFEHLKSSDLDKEIHLDQKFPRKGTFKTLKNKKNKGNTRIK